MDLGTGDRVGAEALSRFPAAWDPLAGLPLDRVVLERSEHQRVEDYDTLKGAWRRCAAVGCGRRSTTSAPGSPRCGTSCPPSRTSSSSTAASTGVGADPVLRVLIRSLVDLAGACGTAVVAEGVETEADALALAGLGVHHGQGWFFGRPAAPSALRASYAPEQPILDAPRATSSNQRVSSPTP
ncbi:EAL domain-containing protein [Dactylosporangium aurantiacum]|uniref:EAL domain-containing protein n=1 Tax=Dactylosporangium aurantiacum TaxID=35754 RepID=A0A9Q9MJV7_9ACTN|nr:EAL domain-containing protein [Dactylosporangium aurantiacum]MDG6108514.1 EAL domain-containing protein [Dactylosporangium aurantiacum]UWZ57310.1 EAL domain-containing protein [Dactylosporangium aurantiacum]